MSVAEIHEPGVMLAHLSEPVRIPRGARWQEFARCAGMDPNIFFPERGDHHAMETAKAVCSECPVRSQCLESGIGELQGVWGGTSRRERKQIRAQRRLADGTPTSQPVSVTHRR